MRIATAVWLLSCCVCVSKLAAQAGPGPTLPPLEDGSFVALLPPAGTHAAVSGDASGAPAVQALIEALRHKGYHVLLPQQVSARLAGHTPDGCRNAATCDPELALATLGADAVVSLAVWQKVGSADQVVVHVRLARGYGQAEIAVGAAGLRDATTAALQAALDDSQHTHEVKVRIESQPDGADLRVDQVLAARTPASISLLPGNHLVSVEAAGYVTSAQYIEVPERPSGPLSYHMRLSPNEPAARNELAAPEPIPVKPREPTRDPRSHEQPTVRETSPWNYVLATVLLGAAVPLLTNVVYTAATRGNCVGEIDAHDRCGERVVLGPAFFASLGLASMAVLGGTAFLIVRPLTSESSAEPRGALLEWHHAF